MSKISEDRALQIGETQVDDEADCYVIAEIGHNHQGSLGEGERAVRRGQGLRAPHAVKLQKRDNRALYTREIYDKPYDNENSFGADLRRAPRGAGVRPRRVRRAAAATPTSSASTSSPRPSTVPSADFLRRARHAGLQDRLGRPQEHAAAASTSPSSASR